MNWSDGGKGKFTEQMMKQNTYNDWDSLTIWNINEGDYYPYLQWENK